MGFSAVMRLSSLPRLGEDRRPTMWTRTWLSDPAPLTHRVSRIIDRSRLLRAARKAEANPRHVKQWQGRVNVARSEPLRLSHLFR